MGDGAVQTGLFHDSLNLASLFKLPVIYIIENNRYGMGTSVERASAAKELYRLGEAVGIPGRQVDGMDVEAVHEAGVEAVERTRNGGGPYILEMLTYRYRGHSMSDPAKYRTKEEVQRMRTEHDAINMLKARLIDDGHAGEDALKEIDREVKAIITDAAEFAQNSPEHDPSELYTDVVVSA
jgi:pyruvate dehydrogenase E1 component alpha subunit